MIWIKKGKEPADLVRFKKQNPKAVFEDLQDPEKSQLKQYLLKEQHSLCAYCNSPITIQSMTIEHWKPRHGRTGEHGDELNYRNLLAVCKGGRGSEFRNQTCDAHKGNQSIKVNPLNQLTLNGIHYRPNGEIYSTDPEINDDLNITLNLNSAAAQFEENRRRSLLRFKKELSQKFKGRSIGEQSLRKIKSQILENPASVAYPGIILDYIDKRLNQF